MRFAWGQAVFVMVVALAIVSNTLVKFDHTKRISALETIVESQTEILEKLTKE